MPSTRIQNNNIQYSELSSFLVQCDENEKNWEVRRRVNPKYIKEEQEKSISIATIVLCVINFQFIFNIKLVEINDLRWQVKLKEFNSFFQLKNVLQKKLLKQENVIN